jgi:hypothetical protein
MLTDNKKYPFTLKKGEKIKIIANNSNHNFPLGSIHTTSWTSLNKSTKLITASSVVYPIKNEHFLYGKDFIIIKNESKKEIQEAIADFKKELVDHNNRIKTEIENLTLRLKFLNENELDLFDENQFKAYKVLQLLKNKKLNDIERAKVIAQLINE